MQPRPIAGPSRAGRCVPRCRVAIVLCRFAASCAPRSVTQRRRCAAAQERTPHPGTGGPWLGRAAARGGWGSWTAPRSPTSCAAAGRRSAPADVGLAAGPRRRTPGLRRDEVATLAGMSIDYFTRLEQARGPQPSTRCSAAGPGAAADRRRARPPVPPGRAARRRARVRPSAHVRPALLHVLDALDDRARVRRQRPRRGAGAEPAGAGCCWATRPRIGDGCESSTTWTLVRRRRAAPWHPARGPRVPRRVRVADLRATWARRRGDADVEDLVARAAGREPGVPRAVGRHEVAVRAGRHQAVRAPAGRHRRRSTAKCWRRPTKVSGSSSSVRVPAPPTPNGCSSSACSVSRPARRCRPGERGER